MSNPSSLSSYLESLLRDACTGLDVQWKRMFGCQAVFTRGSIFGLIWKEGRIALKVPDSALYLQLAEQPGATPWKAGERTMSHWLLLPESFHEDTEALRDWTKRAHTLAGVSSHLPKKR